MNAVFWALVLRYSGQRRKTKYKRKIERFLAHTGGFTKYQQYCCLTNYKFTLVWRTLLTVDVEYAVVIEFATLLNW